jgi:transporter family-2 protein
MKAAQLFLVFSVLAGVLIPFQGALNGLLSQSMKHPLQATLISFGGGVLALLIILLFIQPDVPKWSTIKSLPCYLFVGGILGVIFVTAALLSVPKIGATNFLAAVLLGQMIGSLIIDQFGILQVPVQPITIKRVIGIVVIAIGVWLVQQKGGT